MRTIGYNAVFRPPWSVQTNLPCHDHKGQALAYVYYEEEPGSARRRNCSRAMRRGGLRRISPSCRSCCAPADIPLVVGALVPRSAMLLMLPEHAVGASSAQFLKYAMVDDNVIVVDSISMRVIDIIRGAAHE